MALTMPTDHDIFDGLPDGVGCVRLAEYLSEYREDDDA